MKDQEPKVKVSTKVSTKASIKPSVQSHSCYLKHISSAREWKEYWGRKQK